MGKYVNVFENPEYYRNKLLNIDWIDDLKKIRLDGKALICVFFTNYCVVGCPFCFFQSPEIKKISNEVEARENFIFC